MKKCGIQSTTQRQRAPKQTQGGSLKGVSENPMSTLPAKSPVDDVGLRIEDTVISSLGDLVV